MSLTAKQELDRIGKTLALGLRAGALAQSFHRRPTRERRSTMWFHSLLTSRKSGPSRSRRAQPRPVRRATRLFLEPLEGRALLTSYTAATVTALIADITAANTAGGTNTITLSAASTAPYVLTAVNNTTNGADGLPVIAANDNLTIVGTGDTIERSTAAGTAPFRLFDLAVGGSLTLQSLTLQDGLAFGSGVSAQGGAIDNQGSLTLNDVTVENNIAQGAARRQPAAKTRKAAPSTPAAC